jgi:plastocyanin
MMTRSMRFIRFGLPTACLVGLSLAAGAATVHRVDQYGRAFLFAKIDIARGDTIHFVNDDPFLHQIYVHARDFNFDSDEQPPGQSVDVTFSTAGRFDVQCHIHPLMHLVVNVRN